MSTKRPDRQLATFTLPGAADSPQVRAAHVNGFPGKGLAERLAKRLEQAGLECREVYPEDWGWVFEVEAEGEWTAVGVAPETDVEGREAADRWLVQPILFSHGWFPETRKRREAAYAALVGRLRETLAAEPGVRDLEWRAD